MPAGRPSTFSEEVADAICERLARGESLRSICRSDDMPDRNTVMRWMDARPEFAAKYARAKDIGLDERADELREEIVNEPDVQRARLLLDYGKWYLSKLAPKKYGDRVEAHDDAEAPTVSFQIEVRPTVGGVRVVKPE